MALGAFNDINKPPNQQNLKEKLSDKYLFWEKLVQHIYDNYPNVSEEWRYSGKNSGWTLRVKSKKRNIIYLFPCEGYFKYAFVFSTKGVEAVMHSEVCELIKTELSNARTYVEGTGFRMEVWNETLLNDIFQLIRIKIES